MNGDDAAQESRRASLSDAEAEVYAAGSGWTVAQMVSCPDYTGVEDEHVDFMQTPAKAPRTDAAASPGSPASPAVRRLEPALGGLSVFQAALPGFEVALAHGVAPTRADDRSRRCRCRVCAAWLEPADTVARPPNHLVNYPSGWSHATCLALSRRWRVACGLEDGPAVGDEAVAGAPEGLCSGASYDTPTAEQRDVYRVFAAAGAAPRHCVVEAKAGAGKTALLTAGLSLVAWPPACDAEVDESSRRVPLVLAFNKHNKAELGSSLGGAGGAPRGVEVHTFNSAGNALWRSNFHNRRAVLVPAKMTLVMAHVLADERGPGGAPVPHRHAKLKTFAKHAVQLAKNDALGVASPETHADWQELYARHRSQLCRKLLSGGDSAIEFDDALRLAAAALVTSRRACFEPVLQRPRRAGRQEAEATPMIDYDDQVYMPLWCLSQRPDDHGLAPRRRDLVVADEAQDLNPVCTSLMLELLAPTGRVVCVGDTQQMIYGFRGSTSGGLATLRSLLSSRGGVASLPLSVTWRCPLSAVAAARSLTASNGDPHPISARPGAPGGVLIAGATLVSHPQALFGGDLSLPDAVICRSNAPLASLYSAMVRRGMPVKLVGRGDLRRSLLKLLDKAVAPFQRGRRLVPSRLDALIAAEAARKRRKFDAAMADAAAAEAAVEAAAAAAAGGGGARAPPFRGAACEVERGRKASDAADNAACLHSLLSELAAERGEAFATQDALSPLRARISALFGSPIGGGGGGDSGSDSDGGGGGGGGRGGAPAAPAPRQLILVTAHKSKGKECRVVYVLQPEDMWGLTAAVEAALAAVSTAAQHPPHPPPPATATAAAAPAAAVAIDEEAIGERNVSYVAITRTTGALVLLEHVPCGRGAGQHGEWVAFDPSRLLPPLPPRVVAAEGGGDGAGDGGAAEAPTQEATQATQPAGRA